MPLYVLITEAPGCQPRVWMQAQNENAAAAVYQDQTAKDRSKNLSRPMRIVAAIGTFAKGQAIPETDILREIAVPAYG